MHTLYTYSILKKCSMYTKYLPYLYLTSRYNTSWKVPWPYWWNDSEDWVGLCKKCAGCDRCSLSLWFTYSNRPSLCMFHALYIQNGGVCPGLPLCTNPLVLSRVQTLTDFWYMQEDREIGQDPPKGGFHPWGWTHQLAPISLHTQEIH